MNVVDTARTRAEAWLRELPPPRLDEPFVVCWLRARRALGVDTDAGALLEFWRGRAPGSPTGASRYRWELTHQHLPVPPWSGPPASWRPWRSAEARAEIRDPYAFEGRLTIPILLAEVCQLLEELRPASDLAAELLAEAEPIVRRDLAQYIQALHAASDVFALYALARRPLALQRFWPVAIAIAATYAAHAERDGGVVLGTRFPLHGRPLASTSAELASAMLALSTDLPAAGRLIAHVRAGLLPTGGFADAGGDEDVLTIFVCTDLLQAIDPSFDPGPSLRALAAHQHASGMFRAVGPEAPWLTSEVGRLLSGARAPFADRFRWPVVLAPALDRKTGLPSFTHFEALCGLFDAVAGLAGVDTEVAFLDLAGFRAFNNRQGQERGDQALRLLATALAELPRACAIRDGGDEFLIVGAPTGSLAASITAFRDAWPARFRACFGPDVPPVVPRILTGRAPGRGLARAREALGRAVEALKRDAPFPPPEGVVKDLGPL